MNPVPRFFKNFQNLELKKTWFSEIKFVLKEQPLPPPPTILQKIQNYFRIRLFTEIGKNHVVYCCQAMAGISRTLLWPGNSVVRDASPVGIRWGQLPGDDLFWGVATIHLLLLLSWWNTIRWLSQQEEMNTDLELLGGGGTSEEWRRKRETVTDGMRRAETSILDPDPN